jgi:hypothetical protein
MKDSGAESRWLVGWLVGRSVWLVGLSVWLVGLSVWLVGLSVGLLVGRFG